MVFASAPVRAATANTSFDAITGKLSVSGACSERFALVVIRRATDGSIWGSSNPDCVHGAYTYNTSIPGSDRDGSIFTVQVFDESSAGASLPTATVSQGGVEPVIFAAPIPTTAITTATITIDTSSLAAAPYDPSPIDMILSQFFGIVADVGDAVQSFTALVADTIKASLIAVSDLFAKNVAILPGGSLKVPTGANQLAGKDWLNAGVTDVFIPNTAITSSSQVVITPTSPTSFPLAVTEKEDGVGFRVSAPATQASAVSFDWFVIQTYDAAQPAAAQSSAADTGNTISSMPTPDVATSQDVVAATSSDDTSSTLDVATGTTDDASQISTSTNQ